MDELLRLLDKILQTYYEEADQIDKNIIESFYKIYDNNDFRHSYSELSSFMDDELLPVQRDQLIFALRLCYERIEALNTTDYPNKNVVLNKVRKLLDHINLESLRINRIESVTKTEARIKEIQAKIEDAVKLRTSKLDEIGAKYDNINTQLVTVLGIFTGIVLSVFGGISTFSSVFNNIATPSVYRLVFITSLTGFVVFNIIVFMFVAIASLIGKPFPVINRENKKRPLSKHWYRKTYTLVNIVLLLAMLCDVFVWILKTK